MKNSLRKKKIKGLKEKKLQKYDKTDKCYDKYIDKKEK